VFSDSNDHESQRPIKDERYRALRQLYLRLCELGVEGTFDPNELEHYYEPIIDVTVAGFSLNIEQRDEDSVRIERQNPSTQPEWSYAHTVADRLDNDLVPALLLGLAHPALAEPDDTAADQ